MNIVGSQNVPIIGQPKVMDFCISMTVHCSCNKVTLLLSGKPGAIVKCPACSILWRLDGFTTNKDASLSVALTPGRDANT